MIIEIFKKIKLPDQSLIAHVNGNYDEQDNWFNKGGYLLALHLKLACQKILKKPLSDFYRIFDFGVGCNRIFGRKPTIQNQLFGCDISKDCINYCENHFRGKYFTCKHSPPLSFENEHFDLVCSYSVFSHLPINLMHDWLKELKRVTKKNGFLILSAHGDKMSKIYLDANPHLKTEYDRNGLIEIEYEPLIISNELKFSSSVYKNIYIKNSKMEEILSHYFEVIYTGKALEPLEFVSDETEKSDIKHLEEMNIGTMQEMFFLRNK